VRASATAFGAATVAAVQAFVFLLAALASAPVRRLWFVARPQHGAALAHVDVQVHLGDPGCVAELQTIVWKTLERAQRTWAPLSLPVDRVVVGAAFPAAGRADIYDDFVVLAGENPDVGVARRRRVVVSLGVRDAGRDLDGWEIAGALVAQIQALVDEQCREHRRVTAAPTAQPVVAATTRLAPPAAAAGPGPSASAAAGETLSAIGVASPAVSTASAAEEVPSLAELLATVQQRQPLVAAGHVERH
jgi:hypothetical protein